MSALGLPKHPERVNGNPRPVISDTISGSCGQASPEFPSPILTTKPRTGRCFYTNFRTRPLENTESCNSIAAGVVPVGTSNGTFNALLKPGFMSPPEHLTNRGGNRPLSGASRRHRAHNIWHAEPLRNAAATGRRGRQGS